MGLAIFHHNMLFFVKTINCGGATLVYGFHSVPRVCTLVLFIVYLMCMYIHDCAHVKFVHR